MVERLEGPKVIGLKQTLKHVKNGEGKVLYLAKDADVKLIQPIKDIVSNKSLKIFYVDTMKELGKLCGIDVGASVVLVLSDK